MGRDSKGKRRVRESDIAIERNVERRSEMP
jgi:hypothetical protein